MRSYFCSSVRRTISVGCAVSTSSISQRADGVAQVGRRQPGRDQPAEGLLARAALRRQVRRLLVGAAAADPVVLLGDVGEVQELREGARDRQRPRRPASPPSSAASASKSLASPGAAALGERADALHQGEALLALPARGSLARAARRAAGRRRAGACGDRWSADTWEVYPAVKGRAFEPVASILPRHGRTPPDPALVRRRAGRARHRARRRPADDARTSRSAPTRRGTAVVVCPGGGYRNLVDGEGGLEGRRVPQRPRRHRLRAALPARPALPPPGAARRRAAGAARTCGRTPPSSALRAIGSASWASRPAATSPRPSPRTSIAAHARRRRSDRSRERAAGLRHPRLPGDHPGRELAAPRLARPCCWRPTSSTPTS